MPHSRPRVALFVTCLVDYFRPSVAFASISLLERAGCDVDVPEIQTCCGQPAFNSGDSNAAKKVIQPLLERCRNYDYLVVPSGSCAGMLRKHLHEIFRPDDPLHGLAGEFSAKCFELTSFLVDVMGVDQVESAFSGTLTYHDSCSGLRELGTKEQPRRLLNSIPGVRLLEMGDCEECCGFGGTFCIKYPEISTKMVDRKIQSISQCGADTVIAGDLGCLLNIAGRLKRTGSPVKARHVAEILAGGDPGPAIGEPS